MGMTTHIAHASKVTIVDGTYIEYANQKDDKNEHDYDDVLIGIITALSLEYAAVKALIPNGEEAVFEGSGAGHRFYVGSIPSKISKKHHKVALCISGMGNNAAAIRAMNLKAHFKNMHSIIMTGIAGGIPNPDKKDEDVKLCDIVVSSEKGICQYDFVKETWDDVTIRCNPRPPSSKLLEAVHLLRAYEYERRYPWREHALSAMKSFDMKNPKIDFPYITRVFYGAIASANTLLKNPEKRDMLRDKFGVRAVEMEGSGIADAAWNWEIGYLVVRGISDYCDGNKNDDWQEYAAIAAAAYTIALIEIT